MRHSFFPDTASMRTDHMTSSAHHPLQRYWDIASAAVQADALATALELGVPDALREHATACSPRPPGRCSTCCGASTCLTAPRPTAAAFTATA
jgi:hypothetical protein